MTIETESNEKVVRDIWDDPINVRGMLAEIQYNLIIDEFEGLTLEEKVDKLIKIYAAKAAYGRGKIYGARREFLGGDF